MKQFLVLLLANVLFLAADAPVITPDGCCRGIRLCGRVRVVTDGRADFRVRVVNANADLRVRWTDMPRRVGEWRKVDANADFTVRLVDAGADFTVRIVDSQPGLP